MRPWAFRQVSAQHSTLKLFLSVITRTTLRHKYDVKRLHVSLQSFLLLLFSRRLCVIHVCVTDLSTSSNTDVTKDLNGSRRNHSWRQKNHCTPSYPTSSQRIWSSLTSQVSDVFLQSERHGRHKDKTNPKKNKKTRLKRACSTFSYTLRSPEWSGGWKVQHVVDCFMESPKGCAETSGECMSSDGSSSTEGIVAFEQYSKSDGIVFRGWRDRDRRVRGGEGGPGGEGERERDLLAPDKWNCGRETSTI